MYRSATIITGPAPPPLVQQAADELARYLEQLFGLRAWLSVEPAAPRGPERYGVAHLLHGDVLPERPAPMHLPEVDQVFEPRLRLRAWRQFNDLPTSPGRWTLAQQRAFIRQLFRLKYNGIYVCLWPHHPFVDFEVRGASVGAQVRQRAAALLAGAEGVPAHAEPR